MFRLAVIILTALSMCAYGRELPLKNSITGQGITWKFSESVPVGQFVNGDYYVIGPVTITSITPKPENGRNGSVLNLPVNPKISGFDDRVKAGHYDPSLRAKLPIRMKPGDALMSTISVEKIRELPPFLTPTAKERKTPERGAVRSASVLTCLAEPVSSDAFRPSYCDREQKIYYANSLRRELLPRLPVVIDTPSIDEWAWHFQRPWLDVLFFGFDAALEYQAQYGREVGRAVGIASLILMLDIPDKENLLVNFVQYGIDLWGIVRAGYPGWRAHGGHGSGRKWPIVFAGIMLGDEDMQSPKKKFPDIKFGEDMQTMYARGWTGATAVYAGHFGRNGEERERGWGAYEHLPPSRWKSGLGEKYRFCCTSSAWVGQALAARIMNAQKIWNHDAFFDYVDRWMTETEDNIESIAKTKFVRDWMYSKEWSYTWDLFVDQMWDKYWYSCLLPPNPVKPAESLEFGYVYVDSSATREFEVKNGGTSDLLIGDIFCPEGFKASRKSFTLSPGESRTLFFTFSPPSKGKYKGRILIVNGDSTNTVSRVSVRGYGIK